MERSAGHLHGTLLLATALWSGVVAKHATSQDAWRLVVDLRVGSVEDGPAQFSDIGGFAIGASGSMFVLDLPSQEIRMFDAGGRFLRRVSRSGSGPGEIRRAMGLLEAPNGEIWVNDPGNGRLAVFSGDGQFLHHHILPPRGYDITWDARFNRDGTLFEYITARRSEGQRGAARVITSTGAVRDTVLLPECGWKDGNLSATEFRGIGTNGRRISAAIPFVANPVIGWDGQGAMWCSDRKRYEAYRVSIPRGDTLARIIGEDASIPIAPKERESAISQLRLLFERIGAPVPDFARIPREKPSIEQLDADDEGNLWLRRASETTEATAFDIWSPSGRLVARATLPFRVAPYRHVIIKRGYVYGVTADADGIPYLVRARLVRE